MATINGNPGNDSMIGGPGNDTDPNTAIPAQHGVLLRVVRNLLGCTSSLFKEKGTLPF